MKKKIIAIMMILILSFNTVVSASTTYFLPQGLGKLHTYTPWDTIRWGWAQGDLKSYVINNGALSNTCGIVTYGAYWAGALTTTFGNVGDMMLVVEEGGIIYPVIMADAKSPRDIGCNAWGHKYGQCVVEFEVLSSYIWSLYRGSGIYISDYLNKPIYKIINLGSVYDSTYYFWNPEQACIDNGLSGYTLLTSPYTSIVVGSSF